MSKTCRAVQLAFAPNRVVKAAGIASAAAALVLLVLFIFGSRRGAPGPETADPPEYTPRRLPAIQAALLAIALSLPFGFVFAARATPLFAAGLFLILWRAIPTTALLATAGALLVVAVPVLTLAIPVDDRGGYDPDYAGERVAVHWVAAAAVAILIFTLVRVLRRGWRGRVPGPPPPPPPASPAPRSRS